MLFEEIFGFEDRVAPVVRKTPELPMDSDLYPYQPPTGESDSLCVKLENEAFANEILGERPAAPPASTPPTFELDFEKIWHNATDRVSRISKAAPERKRRLQEIVDRARRAAPTAIQGSPAWSRLLESAERFCAAALLEV